MLFIPVTWGVRELSLRSIRSHVEASQREAIVEAFAGIQGDFERQQLELLDTAQRVAAEGRVVRGLAAWAPGARPDEELVRFLSALELPDRASVEVYDPSPRLVAWNGFSMPLDDSPSRTAFLEGALSAIATDGPQRTALVVWWPVRDGLRVVGTVRMMKLLEIAVPVENQYLREFSQAKIWSERTHLQVRLRYDVPFDDVLPPGGEVRLLSGIEGSPLGRVFIDRPDEQDVVGDLRNTYNDVLAFWLSLLLLWSAFGLWRWYRAGQAAADAIGLTARFALFACAWWSIRFALIALDVPARYQTGKAPLSPLFDPTHLASSAGWGLLSSTGDLVITSLFALIFAVAFAVHIGSTHGLRPGRLPTGAGPVIAALRSSRTWLHGVLILVCGVLLIWLLAIITQAVILDSTLDYFARTGLLPERLVLVVFSALLILATSFLMCAVAIYWWSIEQFGTAGKVLDMPSSLGAVAVATMLLFVLLVTGLMDQLLPSHAVAMFGASALIAAFAARVRVPVALLTLRTVLPGILVLTAILYPLFYRGMQVQRQMRMVDAAASFEDWRDPRVQYAIERVLLESQSNAQWRELLALPGPPTGQFGLDSLTTAAARNSFLASLGSYEISVTAYRADGSPAGRYYEVEPRLDRTALDELERLDLGLLRGMYEESGVTDVLVEPITDPQRNDRFPYYGVAPFRNSADRILGWLVIRADPRILLREAITPFPRVLVPAGFYGNLPGRLSVAVFRDGALVRSTGDDFGSYRLPDDLSATLAIRGELWQSESIRGKDYYSYYQRSQNPDAISGVPVATVIAVRSASINIFDHLYNLLRLTFGGLIIGLPLYLAGVVVRRRKGLLPAPQVRFRDKILNAFFGVGVITVGIMAIVGLQVVTSENEREIEGRLRQHLERVERTLALDVRGGEMTYRVLERTRIDSLSARVGLDINIYKDNVLVSSSRPQLVRDRLIDPRLPVKAYEALYVDGFKFALTHERLGSFTYTAGFRAVPDEEGRAHYVISIPTLPEQDEIEEEKARTIAYLFGALLLLILVVMITASLLANALTRPIARLRAGINAVALGSFNRIRPLDTRDEISELVDSFNTMQDQLGESRRRLARQERQLAWREMARQVAHEIKNPLTPMKLSVQHLRRSFDRKTKEHEDDFTGLFNRITTTLTEQIDALARIANEFSSFARMPSRVEESIDINSVVEEAAALMQAEVAFSLDLALAPDPLIIQADREEVRRIFINLIKNAIQSIPDDREGEIRILTRRDQEGDLWWAHTIVSDNGGGISDDVKAKIFVPNFSTKTSGTGLGLAIARKSVEDLHGSIGFETVENEGSAFWIRLPLVLGDSLPGRGSEQESDADPIH
ncbi:MAG: HAMP domain-containing protein [Rhodothermales bacterium]|nr:HAMP domain-containing protein [Rhodothermales bacterium]